MSLVENVLHGDRLSLARLLTQVENDTSAGRAALDQLFPLTGRAHIIGITGSPGTGKSSLVNQLARAFRQPDGDTPAPRVGIIAVDPSSPFTGGALLGDRVRMRDASGDAGIFIRSMASRGAVGGLSRATAAAAQVLDAAGFELVMIETVGAGQSEVDIARLAHTSVVVEAPGMGDDIQAIKAGILEIADILVVNKADHPGVENTERALRAMLELAHPLPGKHGPQLTSDRTEQGETSGWVPPVLRATATTGEGVPELVSAILQHRCYLQESGEWQRRDQARLQAEFEQLLREVLVERWKAGVPEAQVKQALQDLAARRISPIQAIEALLHLPDETGKST